MKIIKNPVDQNDKNKRAIQIHHISTKRTTYKSKYNKNNQNLKPKSKPKEYNGKLGLFKSDIPTPYKPIPTNYPFKINNDIKINDASMENQSNQPIETRPSEASRNKDVENIRGQVHTSVTEGDEVLFKSMSSTEEFNKEESSNNHQDDSTHRLKQAQDLLDSTKRRIDEIEKDLKKVNYIDNTIKEDDLTPKQTIKVPPLKKEQIAKIKGEIFENLQLDKSKEDPLTERVEINDKLNVGQTHFSKLLYQSKRSQNDDSNEISEQNMVTESPANSGRIKKNTEEDGNNHSPKEGSAESDKNEDQEEEEDEEDDSQIPLLFVDVNLGKGVMKRIILYEGDDPKYIAEMFAKDNKLEENMRNKLERLLRKQMDGVLSKIDEDEEDADSNH